MPQKSLIRPIESSESIRERVERALIAALISGELGPGELVSVPALAEQFDVSATPVREAMLEMERRGFVQPVKNKGFRVTEVSEQELREITEVRQLLEPPAMHALAARFPQIKAASFRQQADRIALGARTGDLRSYLEIDREFHLGLAGLLGNRMLVDTIADLRSRTRMVGLHRLVESDMILQSAQEHHELVDLLVVGKADEARDLTFRHIGHAVGWWAGRPE